MSKFVSASFQALAFLTKENFPMTLQEALAVASMVPISFCDEELTFGLVEHLECEMDGILHAADIDFFRWTFRAINRRWILVECVRPSRATENDDVGLLAQHFSTAVRATNAYDKKILLLEDSGETVNIFYKFTWPDKEDDLVLVFVPQDILKKCLTKLKLSHFFSSV